MTEPTAEQVDAERERAMSLWATMMDGADLYGIHHAIATALARVRIEAHAAGRNEGLEKAMEAAKKRTCTGHCTHTACTRAIFIADDIRALRGRT